MGNLDLDMGKFPTNMVYTQHNTTHHNVMQHNTKQHETLPDVYKSTLWNLPYVPRMVLPAVLETTEWLKPA